MSSKIMVVPTVVIFASALLFVGSASAQSLTWGNTSNNAITPEFVVGDYWTLSITGAAPNAAVVLQYTENGGPVSYFTLGYTNGSGNYSDSQPETNGHVALWSIAWFVGGQQLGSTYDFEVARLPDHLEAVSSTIEGHTCWQQLPYGAVATFDFQSKDSTGADVVTHNFPMRLYEYWEADPGYELTQYGYSGIYAYTGVGLCATYAFGPIYFGYDNLSVRVGASGVYVGPVRTQNWIAFGYSPGHGKVYNSIDVDVTQ